jgi:hypothetical protein
MRPFLIGILLALSSMLVGCGGDDTTSTATSGSSAGPANASGARTTASTPDGGSREDTHGMPMIKMMGRDMNER